MKSIQTSKKITENDRKQGAKGEGITTETFLALCYKHKLTHADLEMMTIGGCLDYIDEFIEMSNPQKRSGKKSKSI